jgi:uncharacterized protein (TIRG00374 family)
MAAFAVGIVLFAVTLYYTDLEGTVERTGRLGLALPLILLPGTCWQLLRTWGWSVAFPDGARPRLTRLFRVRLAADAISFFTVRGITGEPLKVMLLYDRELPEVVTAAIALERIAFAVVAIAMAGLVSFAVVLNLSLPATWGTVFTSLAIVSVAAVTVIVLGVVVRRRTGDYLGRLVLAIGRATGRNLETSRVVKFILEVEDILLELLRGSRKRLVLLTCLPVVCYLIMAFEVWLVFWVLGEPISVLQALAIETFARLASIASAAIPGNVGALEASNAGVAAALGLSGGGALALVRRVRALLWAALGLAVYPRLGVKRRV